MIVGLAFGFGIGSCGEEGAFAPTAGMGCAGCGVSSVAGVGSSFEVMVVAYTLDR